MLGEKAVAECCNDAFGILTGAGGSSRAISLSLRAGMVIAPTASTSAVTSVLTAMSRSVPEMRIPLSVVWTRRFARTGSVVLLGTAGVTAASPSWSFSRVMVKRIRCLAECRVHVEGWDQPSVSIFELLRQ